jgi:heat shock protein HslJ
VKRSIALVLTMLVVASCSAAGGGGASPSASTPPASLDGRTFLSTSITGRDLLPGTTVRLAFKDGRLSLNAGCNQIGGDYTVTDGRLPLGSMMSTEMGCDQARMAQDAWVSTFVDGAAVVLAADSLTLANSGVTMNLTDRRVADPDHPLVGTRWVVDGIRSGDATSSIPMGVTASILIGPEGRMAVEGGCNRGSAPVTVGPDTLDVGPMAMTRMACPPEQESVEQAVVAVLQGTVHYTIEADVLTLANGPAGLTLRAAA